MKIEISIHYSNIYSVVCNYLKVLSICLNSLVSGRIKWKDNLNDIYIVQDAYN